jgi:hypothetical protein
LGGGKEQEDGKIGSWEGEKVGRWEAWKIGNWEAGKMRRWVQFKEFCPFMGGKKNVC